MSQAHTRERPLAGPGHMASLGGTQDTWITSHPWQRRGARTPELEEFRGLARMAAAELGEA